MPAIDQGLVKVGRRKCKPLPDDTDGWTEQEKVHFQHACWWIINPSAWIKPSHTFCANGQRLLVTSRSREGFVGAADMLICLLLPV